MGLERWASRAPTDPQEVARWVTTRRRNWRDHVDRIGQDRWASGAPTEPQEVARWVRTRRRNLRDHVDRMGQDRRASWTPTDPQEVRQKIAREMYVNVRRGLIQTNNRTES
jgi:hypothetical protein